MDKNISALIQAAVESEDQTQTQAFADFAPPEAGKTVARFIEYIELGKQPRKAFQGKAKAPADSVRITFELLSPKHIKEVTNEAGAKIKVAERISFNVPKLFSDKAKYKKLFNKMNRGRANITHMTQMLGEAFILDIVHNTSGEGENKKVYANITDSEGAYTIAAPYMEDPLTGNKQEVPVPPAISPIRIFLWNNPTKETWDSLFIDGTRSVKTDGGQEKEVSKNWLQETILKATNVGGSRLEQLLGGADALPDMSDVETSELVDDEDEVEEQKAPPAKKAPAKKAAVTKPAATSIDEALKAMGLL